MKGLGEYIDTHLLCKCVILYLHKVQEAVPGLKETEI